MSSHHTLIVQPHDGRKPVLDVLNKAVKSIDLTIYEISDSEIMAALQTAAQDRNVVVRVIYNWYSFDSSQQQGVMQSIDTLISAGIECRRAAETFAVTHEKAFVIDGTVAIVMSFNLVANYFSGTRDFGVITTVADEVAEIAAVFEADWNQTPITPTVASMVWSPTNSRTKLTKLIEHAKTSLDIYCEEAEDPGTIGAMIDRAKHGVNVRFIAAVLLDEKTQANLNASGITTMLAGGVEAVCKDFLYIHAKMVLADYGTPHARAYIGSENFSCTSLDENRECGIIVTNPVILDRLKAVYESDWARIGVIVTPDNTPLKPCYKTKTSSAN